MTELPQPVLRGHCLCGACSFELVGPHNWVGHCHCESCRRSTASPFTTWIGQENGRWKLTGKTPVSYESSSGNERGFCGTCGSPMYFHSRRYPNECHFYAALLESPDQTLPSAHFHADEMLSWIHLADTLRRE
jgi:hypothetical protein